MELKILYFGMIAEATDCNEEEISLQSGSTVEQLIHKLNNKYDKLKHLSFNIAIDKEISDHSTLLSTNSEIALLPPFAGG